MINNFEQIKSHLEFLGYQVERLSKDESNDVYGAKHSDGNSIFLLGISPNIVMFKVVLNSRKLLSNDMIVYINEVNKKNNLTKIYCDAEQGKVTINFESYFAGEYTKERFGEFINMYQHEVALFNQTENFRRVWLD